MVIQNEKGDEVISVYDRDRRGSTWSGSRYHQTREGGNIHTDNVNTPEPWDFLYMSCLSAAKVGGETILVDGLEVYKELKKNYPQELALLMQDFYWEMRGLEDRLYQAPIISLNKDGEPLFRHLRPYMESAHQKAKVELTEKQLMAIDTLDAITNSSKFQTRLSLKKGDILIAKDSQVLHGRTCFCDDDSTVDFTTLQAGKGKQLKRTVERIWIKQ